MTEKRIRINGNDSIFVQYEFEDLIYHNETVLLQEFSRIRETLARSQVIFHGN